MKILSMSTAAIALALASVTCYADDDDEHERGHSSRGSSSLIVSDPTYVKECGSCHLAFPPALLPAASWQKLMNDLGSHFGDNAELAPDDRKHITDYLSQHAGTDRIGRGETLRITETSSFRRKHHEVSDRLVKNNPDIKSFANCKACHPAAEKGNFDEHQVRIPGRGRWE